VIDNLVVNAAKYGRAGGVITISAEARGADLCLRVKDNGIGIPRDMLERVFDMFTQVERSMERSRGGLGIGLTLVRRIVELHGGSVVAKSGGHGKGTEIVVLLPASPAAQTIAAPQRAPQPAGPRMRIVVTDDNEDSAISMATALRSLGHEVRMAFDGAHCMEVCRAFEPQVLLLDIGMPRVNGYDAARLIRMETWAARLVIIAMTGWGQEEDRRRAGEAGFNHHLVKPVDFDALLEILRTSPVAATVAQTDGA